MVGSKNVATKQAKAALEQLAQEHTGAALAVLVDVMQNAEAPAARVSAAVALLDRGYGRPRQAVEHSGGVDVGTVLDAARKRVSSASKRSR